MQHFSEQTLDRKEWQHVSIVAIFLLFVMVTPGLQGFHFDLVYFIKWAQHNYTYGLRNAYGSGTDYLPVYQYVLWIYGKLCGSNEVIAERINYLKLFTLVFEFWGLSVVYRWIHRRYLFPLFLILALSNIGYSYNTLIWSQIDAIWTTLGFAALYYAWLGKLKWSSFFISVCICTKLQAVIFLPLWGLLTAYSLLRLSTRQIVQEMTFLLLISLSTIGLVVAPFLMGDHGLQAIKSVITDSFGRFPVVTLSADNMWILLVPGAASTNDALPVFSGLSYRVLGLAAFFIGSGLALLPLLNASIRQYTNKLSTWQPLDKQVVWLSGALVSLLFFYCNTEMHERYVHPAAIFLTAYAFHTRKWGAYLLFSLAYFLNLEVLYRWFNLPNYSTLVFDPHFVAALYTLVLIWLTMLLIQRCRFLAANRPVQNPVAV
jgi:Gpi18-like mannosyltransferase